MVRLSNLIFTSGVLAHSWLDCIGYDVPYYGGPQYFTEEFYDYCAGYGRGYPGRMNTDINTIYTVEVIGHGQPDPATTQVCGAFGSSSQYSERFPMLKTKAGTTLKFWYQLDNHRGDTTVHIVGYGVPGKQIITYADQTNATDQLKYPFTQNCLDITNDNSWCTALWTLPSAMEPGVYSYVWNWHLDSTEEGEEYNTCFDILIEE